MTDSELEAHYRRYIDCLNSRRLGEMGQFVHAELVSNGKAMTREEWQAGPVGHAISAVPDFHWDIQQIVVQDNQVAARLIDTGTLQSEWLGRHPSGKSMTFPECVFYKFRDGRIHEIWSLFDFQAIDAQLTA